MIRYELFSLVLAMNSGALKMWGYRTHGNDSVITGKMVIGLWPPNIIENIVIILFKNVNDQSEGRYKQN